MMGDVEIIEMPQNPRAALENAGETGAGWVQRLRAAGPGIASTQLRLNSPDSDFSLKFPYFQNSWVRTFPSLFFSYSICAL